MAQSTNTSSRRHTRDSDAVSVSSRVVDTNEWEANEVSKPFINFGLQQSGNIEKLLMMHGNFVMFVLGSAAERTRRSTSTCSTNGKDNALVV